MNDDPGMPFSRDQLGTILTKWSVEKRATADHAGTDRLPHRVEQPQAAPSTNVAEPLSARPAVLDPDVIERMRKTHAALLERIVRTYAQHAPAAIAGLDRAIAAESTGDLRTTAHSLKSSSAQVGAMRLSTMCRDLESRLKQASEWDSPANLAAVEAIKSEYAAVAAELAALELEPSSPADAPAAPQPAR